MLQKQHRHRQHFTQYPRVLLICTTRHPSSAAAFTLPTTPRTGHSNQSILTPTTRYDDPTTTFAWMWLAKRRQKLASDGPLMLNGSDSAAPKAQTTAWLLPMTSRSSFPLSRSTATTSSLFNSSAGYTLQKDGKGGGVLSNKRLIGGTFFYLSVQGDGNPPPPPQLTELGQGTKRDLLQGAEVADIVLIWYTLDASTATALFSACALLSE